MRRASTLLKGLIKQDKHIKIMFHCQETPHISQPVRCLWKISRDWKTHTVGWDRFSQPAAIGGVSLSIQCFQTSRFFPFRGSMYTPLPC